jgi:hypothetical protein
VVITRSKSARASESQVSHPDGSQWRGMARTVIVVDRDQEAKISLNIIHLFPERLKTFLKDPTRHVRCFRDMVFHQGWEKSGSLA